MAGRSPLSVQFLDRLKRPGGETPKEQHFGLNKGPREFSHLAEFIESRRPLNGRVGVVDKQHPTDECGALPVDLIEKTDHRERRPRGKVGSQRDGQLGVAVETHPKIDVVPGIEHGNVEIPAILFARGLDLEDLAGEREGKRGTKKQSDNRQCGEPELIHGPPPWSIV